MVDLGCGIGGDLSPSRRAGLTAAGVDLDPVRVAVATANLAALGLPGAVEVADATSRLTPFDVVFADPARRAGRGRVLVDGWTPPWSFVDSLLAGHACVKIAPGIPHELSPPGSRPSGSATTARSRRPRCGRPARQRPPAPP